MLLFFFRILSEMFFVPGVSTVSTVVFILSVSLIMTVLVLFALLNIVSLSMAMVFVVVYSSRLVDFHIKLFSLTFN